MTSLQRGSVTRVAGAVVAAIVRDFFVMARLPAVYQVRVLWPCSQWQVSPTRRVAATAASQKDAAYRRTAAKLARDVHTFRSSDGLLRQPRAVFHQVSAWGDAMRSLLSGGLVLGLLLGTPAIVGCEESEQEQLEDQREDIEEMEEEISATRDELGEEKQELEQARTEAEQEREQQIQEDILDERQEVEETRDELQRQRNQLEKEKEDVRQERADEEPTAETAEQP